MSRREVWNLHIASIHEQGWRDYQEDFQGYLDLGDLQVFVVSDGMGGLSSGDVASQTIVNTTLSYLQEHLLSARSYADRYQIVKNSVLLALEDLQKKGKNRRMGATLVLAIIHPKEHWIGVTWVGDSRAYLAIPGTTPPQVHSDRMASGKGVTRVPIPLTASSIQQTPWSLWLLTRDHSFVWRTLVDSGELPPEHVRDHPMKNRLNLALSTQTSIGELTASLRYHEFLINTDQGVLILCTDGVWESLSSEDLLHIAGTFTLSPDQAASEIKRLVESHQYAVQGGDNYTAWIVTWSATSDEGSASSRTTLSSPAPAPSPSPVPSTIAPSLPPPSEKGTAFFRWVKDRWPLVFGSVGVAGLIFFLLIVGLLGRGKSFCLGEQIAVEVTENCKVCGTLDGKKKRWIKGPISSKGCPSPSPLPAKAHIERVKYLSQLPSRLREIGYQCGPLDKLISRADSAYQMYSKNQLKGIFLHLPSGWRYIACQQMIPSIQGVPELYRKTSRKKTDKKTEEQKSYVLSKRCQPHKKTLCREVYQGICKPQEEIEKTLRERKRYVSVIPLGTLYVWLEKGQVQCKVQARTEVLDEGRIGR